MSIEMTRRTVLLVPLAAVAGCTSMALKKDEDVLLERARAYWTHILSNDLTEAWRYEEISRDPRWTLQAYLKRAQLAYDEVQVRGAVLTSGNEARVEVMMRYSLPIMRIRKQEAVLQDVWKKLDGQWYHAESKSIFFKPTETKSNQDPVPE